MNPLYSLQNVTQLLANSAPLPTLMINDERSKDNHYVRLFFYEVWWGKLQWWLQT